MVNLLSPGVAIQEINTFTGTPSTATTTGAFAGFFNWGPVNERTLFTNETGTTSSSMVSKLQPPNQNTAAFYLSAANFLAYGNSLYIVRANSAGLATSSANGAPSVMIPNKTQYYLQNYNGNLGVYGPWFARYPGILGNSLTVSICPGTQAYQANLTSIYGITANANIGFPYVVASTSLAANVVIGDQVQVGVSPQSNGWVTVTGINGANIALSSGAVSTNGAALVISRRWQYAPQFTGPPSTSAYANNKSSLNDQVHVVVVDSNSAFYGSTTNGFILEKWPFLSKAVDATNNDSSPAYYPKVLLNSSNYIYWADHIAGTTNWGNTAQGVTFSSPILPVTSSLSGGADITNPYSYTNQNTGDTNNDAGLIVAWSYFQATDDVSIQLVPVGPASITVQQYVIDNIVNSRQDCVAFISPRYADVVNQNGNEALNIVNNYLPAVARSSTYVVCDSGWKYQFDRYNQIYRYLPLNPDIAGLCVYTDATKDPWWSPAGYNRGAIKNVTKLSWNPNNLTNASSGSLSGIRDLLYQNAVNPVVTFKNVGTVLFGDKTFTTQPSAFSHINVRRLFLVLEATISQAAKYSLFEFNDSYTQTAFINTVTPYLQQVQSRRGIAAFQVVCDATNNTPDVINNNQFVGSIYVQPAFSINFITLQFVAVGQGVSFSTIIGQSQPAQ